MNQVRSMTRRSFLAEVAGGGLILGAAVLLAGPAQARRRRRTQMVVDADPRDPARSMQEEEARRRPPVVHREIRRHRRPRIALDMDLILPERGPVGTSRFILCPGNRRCPGRNR